jgi:hypothetical protein
MIKNYLRLPAITSQVDLFTKLKSVSFKVIWSMYCETNLRLALGAQPIGIQVQVKAEGGCQLVLGTLPCNLLFMTRIRKSYGK